MIGSDIRFRPQLESLDGRTLPSSLAVWGVDAGGGVVHRGAESPIPQRGRGSTEEIPAGGAASGIVGSIWGSPSGLTANRNAGEEIPS